MRSVSPGRDEYVKTMKIGKKWNQNTRAYNQSHVSRINFVVFSALMRLLWPSVSLLRYVHSVFYPVRETFSYWFRRCCFLSISEVSPFINMHACYVIFKKKQQKRIIKRRENDDDDDAPWLFYERFLCVCVFSFCARLNDKLHQILTFF